MTLKTKKFLILFLPFLFLLPFSNQFPYPVNSNYSDLTITHFPNAIYIRNAIQENHQIPLWSEAILCGYPLSANPLSGLWYPPSWLLLVLPLPFAFNFLIIFHLILGGIGVYLVLQSEGYKDTACLIGAILFEGMPKLFAHYAAGHITLVFAVSLMPWLLLASNEYKKKEHIYKFLPGIILGLIILADVRWSLFSIILWFFYILYIEIRNHNHENKKIGIRIIQIIPFIFRSGLVAVLLAAPLLLPFIQYLALSTRAHMGGGDNLTLSLPALSLFGLFFPDMGGYAEWVVYPGAYSIVALIWCLNNQRLRSINAFWLIILFGGIIFSLGDLVPGLSHIINLLPFINLLRVPSRLMFITGFAFSIITASVTNQLLSKTSSDLLPKRSNYAMVFLIIFVVTLAASINIINHKVMIEFIYGAAAISLFTFILIIGQNGETRWWWSTVVITLVIIDCCVVNISQIKYRPFIDVLSEGQRIAEFLQFNSKDNRVYSPSYSLPQQTAAIYHLELADGIDPLQLTSYVDYMDTATGIPNLSYSVTLPPFSSGNPNTDNMYYQPNLKKLGMLNVQHIVSEYSLQSTFGMRLVKIIDGTWIYLNEFKYPRAWVQKEINGIFKTDTIISLSSSPNAIYIKADGPGLLVSSELYFPGWQVFVDGKKETIIPFEGVLRGVLLQRGRHEISFLFIPYPVYIGIFLSLCTTIFLIFITIKKKSNE